MKISAKQPVVIHNWERPSSFSWVTQTHTTTHTHTHTHTHTDTHSHAHAHATRETAVSQLTVIGLGTAATMMPMVGCGESRAGLLDDRVAWGPGVPASALLGSTGTGECSFCSCCFFWIFRCSCCLA